jgi:predicted DNA binding CopG/RHH family protein
MPSKLNITSAIKAAQGARTVDEAMPEKLEKKDKPISLRMPETDHNRFRSLFAKSGLNLSEGCIMAITYVAEMIEAGAFTISKAGVQDVRNRNI